MNSRILITFGVAMGMALPLTAAAQQGSGKRVAAERTVPKDPALAAQGEKLYAQCAGCHGAKGEGRIGIAPSLTSKTFLEAASDAMLIQTITHGRAGTTMVPWGGSLTGTQIQSIVAYLRHTTPTEPGWLDQSPVKGDAAKGEKVFAICASCHGRSGAGYQESSSGTGIGRKVFVDSVSDGYMRYIIKKGKSGTAMKAFASKAATAVANLSDQEVEDVIAYLRKNAW